MEDHRGAAMLGKSGARRINVRESTLIVHHAKKVWEAWQNSQQRPADLGSAADPGCAPLYAVTGAPRNCSTPPISSALSRKSAPPLTPSTCLADRIPTIAPVTAGCRSV